MADANSTATNPSAASDQLTASRLAAFLGELQPNPDADMTTEHCERQEALFAAAAYLPIRDGADAALAISGAADLVVGAMSHDLEDAILDQQLRRATMILARLAEWVTEQHGARPLRTPWPRWAGLAD